MLQKRLQNLFQLQQQYFLQSLKYQFLYELLLVIHSFQQFLLRYQIQVRKRQLLIAQLLQPSLLMQPKPHRRNLLMHKLTRLLQQIIKPLGRQKSYLLLNLQLRLFPLQLMIFVQFSILGQSLIRCNILLLMKQLHQQIIQLKLHRKHALQKYLLSLHRRKTYSQFLAT